MNKTIAELIAEGYTLSEINEIAAEELQSMIAAKAAKQKKRDAETALVDARKALSVAIIDWALALLGETEYLDQKDRDELVEVFKSARPYIR